MSPDCAALDPGYWPLTSLLLIRLEMGVGDAQLRHRDLGGVGAGDEVADHVVGLDRQPRLDVTEHRGGHPRAFGGQQDAGALEERARRRVTRCPCERAASV